MKTLATPGSANLVTNSKLNIFIRVLKKRPDFLFGYIIVFLILFIAIFAPLFAPFDPYRSDAANYLKPPQWPYIMGTDATGMDVFSRVLYAPRVDLAIALLGTLLSAFLGVVLGSIAGFYDGTGKVRGFGSSFIMRSADVVQAFPVFVFAIAVVAVLGQSIQSLVLAITFVNAPIYLRLMRSQCLSIRRMRYVEAAYIAGTPDIKIITGHVIPNSIAPLLAQLSVNIGWAILLTSALSFIGAGVEAPTPEWGSMISMGFQNIVTGHWWPSIFPGLALALTVLGFALVGSSVEILADPVRTRKLLLS